MLLATLRQHRKTSQLTNARERHEIARRKWAGVEAEVTYANRMTVFYGDELKRVNQNVDYWRYAELRQKQDDSIALADKYTLEARELYAKAQARGEEVKRLEAADTVPALSRNGGHTIKCFWPAFVKPKGDRL